MRIAKICRPSTLLDLKLNSFYNFFSGFSGQPSEAKMKSQARRPSRLHLNVQSCNGLYLATALRSYLVSEKFNFMFCGELKIYHHLLFGMREESQLDEKTKKRFLIRTNFIKISTSRNYKIEIVLRECLFHEERSKKATAAAASNMKQHKSLSFAFMSIGIFYPLSTLHLRCESFNSFWIYLDEECLGNSRFIVLPSRKTPFKIK